MTDREPPDDVRLAGLLRAVHGEPDPALWARARARIEAGGTARVPRAALWDWLTRPAALGASLAILLVTLGLGVVAVDRLQLGTSSGPTTLTEALLSEDGANGTLDVAPDRGGSAAPHDTGGQS